MNDQDFSQKARLVLTILIIVAMGCSSFWRRLS